MWSQILWIVGINSGKSSRKGVDCIWPLFNKHEWMRKSKQMYDEKGQFNHTMSKKSFSTEKQMVPDACCLGFIACTSYYSLWADDALDSYLNTHTKRESSKQQMDNKPQAPQVCQTIHQINEDIYFLLSDFIRRKKRRNRGCYHGYCQASILAFSSCSFPVSLSTLKANNRQ